MWHDFSNGCDLTRTNSWHDASCLLHDVFIRVKWRTHTCEMTHAYVWHDSFYVWCDMADAHAWHDSLMCVTWLIFSLSQGMVGMKEQNLLEGTYIVSYPASCIQLTEEIRLQIWASPDLTRFSRVLFSADLKISGIPGTQNLYHRLGFSVFSNSLDIASEKTGIIWRSKSSLVWSPPWADTGWQRCIGCL